MRSYNAKSETIPMEINESVVNLFEPRVIANRINYHLALRINLPTPLEHICQIWLQQSVLMHDRNTIL